LVVFGWIARNAWLSVPAAVAGATILVVHPTGASAAQKLQVLAYIAVAKVKWFKVLGDVPLVFIKIFTFARRHTSAKDCRIFREPAILTGHAFTLAAPNAIFRLRKSDAWRQGRVVLLDFCVNVVYVHAVVEIAEPDYTFVYRRIKKGRVLNLALAEREPTWSAGCNWFLHALPTDTFRWSLARIRTALAFRGFTDTKRLKDRKFRAFAKVVFQSTRHAVAVYASVLMFTGVPCRARAREHGMDIQAFTQWVFASVDNVSVDFVVPTFKVRRTRIPIFVAGPHAHHPRFYGPYGVIAVGIVESDVVLQIII
jgi:hypothetical protein